MLKRTQTSHKKHEKCTLRYYTRNTAHAVKINERENVKEKDIEKVLTVSIISNKQK